MSARKPPGYRPVDTEEFDPYDNLYESTIPGGETRKLSKDDIDPELRRIIEGQLDHGLTLSCDWKGARERRAHGERGLRVTAIHIRRPRVQNRLAEQIVEDVSEQEIDLTIDLGDGQHVYKIRRISKPS